MEEKVFFIFTEALKTTGLGHLGRCTALAEKLTEQGCAVNLFVHCDEIMDQVTISMPYQALDWKKKR